MNFAIKIEEKSFLNKHNNSRIKVLKDININIKSKEFVCIVGPSGCGKTTLMNMIGGLIKTEDQIIEFNDNKNLSDLALNNKDFILGLLKEETLYTKFKKIVSN